MPRSRTPPPQLVRLGHTIKMRRTDRRLTLMAASKRGDIHRNYLGQIERGEVNPTCLTLLRVAGTLSVPLETLIRDAQRDAPED